MFANLLFSGMHTLTILILVANLCLCNGQIFPFGGSLRPIPTRCDGWAAGPHCTTISFDGLLSSVSSTSIDVPPTSISTALTSVSTLRLQQARSPQTLAQALHRPPGQPQARANRRRAQVPTQEAQITVPQHKNIPRPLDFHQVCSQAFI